MRDTRPSSKRRFLLVLGALSAAAVAPSAALAEPGTDTYGIGESEIEYGSLAPIVTESGPITLSIDGSGSNGGAYAFRSGAPQTLRVQKPAGATVRRAFLAATSSGFSGRKLNNGDVTLDGAGFAWQISTTSSISSWNHWAEVTSLVKPKIDAAAPGILSLNVGEVGPTGIEGEILAVIFDDPAQTTTNTVILLFGAQNIAGDTFKVALGSPINKADPNLAIDLSLGISFGFQSATSAIQRSIVDVNGSRLTSLAGGHDDGAGANGALLTVGGIGDTNANPPPFDTSSGPRKDDELYSLLPLVADGATKITVFSQNPSNDDNIFFAALNLRAAAAIVGEGIVLGPMPAPDSNTGTSFTATAKLQDDSGQPIVGRTVTFTAFAGPNAGTTGTAVTDESGSASFTYVGTAAGVDEIKATFVDSHDHVQTSNTVIKRWLQSSHAPTPVCQDVTRPVDQTCVAHVQPAEVGGMSFDLDGDPISLALGPAGPYALGATDVTMTVTDVAELSAQCTAVITAVDETPPTLACPAPIVAECTGDHAASVALGSAAGDDNCGSPAITGPSGAASYPLGGTPVSFTATDGSGNDAVCTTSVTVVDTLPPALACPAPIVAECTGNGAAIVDVPSASASDACGDVIIAGPAGAASYPLGTTTIGFGVTDDFANLAFCATSVTVADTTAPVFDPATLGPRTVLGSCGSAPVSFTPPAAADACQAVSVTCTPVSGNSIGANTSTCTATDASGNQATTTITVHVVQPLRLAFQAPLRDDNAADDIDTDADVSNLFQVGRIIPNRVQVFACNGADVTTSIASSVTVRLTVHYRNDASTGAGSSIVPEYDGVGDTGGVFVLRGDHFHYNQQTDPSMYPPASIRTNGYFNNVVTLTYNAAPGIVAAQEDARLESK